MSEERLMQQLKSIENTNFNDCLKEALELIAEEARRLAPVDTGELKNSIHSELGEEGGFIAVDAEHGPFVEYGTDRMAAQPYLRPAIETKTDEALQLIAKAADEKIKEVVS